MTIRWPGMRWTKTALLLFGFGLVLGFVAVVVGDMPRFERIAAAAMALALVLLPLALVADGRGLVIFARIAARLARRRRPKPRSRRRARPPTRRPAARRNHRQRR